MTFLRFEGSPPPPIAREETSSLLRGQIDDDLHVVDWEKPGHPPHRPLQPVLVDAGREGDHVPLFESELPLVLRVEIVQRLAARGLLRRGGMATCADAAAKRGSAGFKSAGF